MLAESSHTLRFSYFTLVKTSIYLSSYNTEYLKYMMQNTEIYHVTFEGFEHTPIHGWSIVLIALGDILLSHEYNHEAPAKSLTIDKALHSFK